MKNKPVAWINERHLTHDEFIEEGEMDATLYRENDTNIQRNYKLIPLYTHPANNCKHGVDDGACKECYQEATHLAKESKTKDRFSNYETIYLQCGGTVYKPAKTLTDEEIWETICKVYEGKQFKVTGTKENLIEICVEILRKAQAKSHESN